MKKIILATALLLGAALGTSAGAQLENVALDYDSNNLNAVIVSGKTTLGRDTKITMSVFKKDKDYSDITLDGVDVSDILKNVDTVISAADGSWSFTYEPDLTEDYDIYLAEGNLAGVKYPFFIGAQMASKFSTIKTGTQANIEGVLAVENDFKAIYPLESDRLKITPGTHQAVGTALYNVREGLLTPSDITNNLKTGLLYVAYAQNGSSASLEELLDAFTVAGIGESFYSIYKSSPAAVKDAVASVCNALCYTKTVTEFNALLKSQLILSGVEKSSNWTEAVTYLDLLGNSKYNANKQAMAVQLVGNTYTMTQLIDAIDILAAQYGGLAGNVVGGGGGSSGGSGGSYGGSSFGGSVIIPEPAPVVKDEEEPEKEVQTVFNDVLSTHWAFDFVNYLRWNDIIEGDENGNFNPGNSITRAEYVKIICEAFDITTDNSTDFNDVEPGDWYYPYVQAAALNGLVYGDDMGNFNPLAKIKREDIAVIAYRLIQSLGINMQDNREFLDNSDISGYAKEAVSRLAGAEILTGSENKFRPADNATRAEAAAIIYKIIKNYNIKGR